MIRLDVRSFDRDEWSRHLYGFAEPNLMQAWEYAEAKARTGPWAVRRGVFLAGEEVVGMFQALVRPLPFGLPGGLVWINRGPLWHRKPATGVVPLTVMLDALRHYFVRERKFYLRIAPPAPEGELTDAAIREAGFAPAGTPGWASAVLDLSPESAVLRKGLKQKWRNCLNKGEKLGFEVETGSGPALFDAFVDAHQAFTGKRGFATSVTPELLRALSDLAPEAHPPHVLIARHQGKVAGAVLMAGYGSTCEYLAGNTSDEGRRMNAGQVLLWQAVEEMKARGYTRFDLGGLDPDLTPKGIRRFKEGLGGAPYRLAGEIEAGADSLPGRLVRWKVNRARAAEG